MSGIEIAQADREALERFIREDAPLGMKMMFGGDPAYKLAQAFARHRHEARAKALEEAAKAAEEGGRSGRTTMLAQEIRTLHDAVMAIPALRSEEREG